ncbi:MAG: hypothetical protein ABIR80_12830, partial [Opitutaceae bacterium]
ADVSQPLIAISARVGAFALPRGTADSAVLTTLPPGNYTVQVTSLVAGGGEVLLEVYDVR